MDLFILRYCSLLLDLTVMHLNFPKFVDFGAGISETLEKVSVSTTLAQSRLVSISTTLKINGLGESWYRQCGMYTQIFKVYNIMRTRFMLQYAVNVLLFKFILSFLSRNGRDVKLNVDF